MTASTWSRRKRPVEERFWEKVDASGDCWEWTASLNHNGYGKFGISPSHSVLAHRFAWQTLIGDIPERMVIDHLCRNPRCVNPDHLRVTTRRQNTIAGYNPPALNARKTHCSQGHVYDEANIRITKTGRRCRTCDRIRDSLRQRGNRRAA